MESAPKIYVVQCSRCRIRIETFTEPGLKSNAFLCNSCHMKWLDIERKLEGKVYADEKREAFIKFLNDLPYLRNL